MNFKNYASYYDDIYKKKTYIKEVKFLASILKFQKDKSYFDYGCGTFEHSIKLLNKVKKIVGIDYSKSMIEISREKIKKIKKLQKIKTKIEICEKNITDFKYKKKLEGGYCLFHVFSYLRTNKEIKKFFFNLKNNLKPESLFLFDYWYLPALNFQGVRNSKKIFKNRGYKILKLVNSKKVKKNIVQVNYDFEIYKKKKIIKKFKETHVMRAFDLKEIKKLVGPNFKIIKNYSGFENKQPSKKRWDCSTLIMKI